MLPKIFSLEKGLDTLLLLSQLFCHFTKGSKSNLSHKLNSSYIVIEMVCKISSRGVHVLIKKIYFLCENTWKQSKKLFFNVTCLIYLKKESYEYCIYFSLFLLIFASFLSFCSCLLVFFLSSDSFFNLQIKVRYFSLEHY